MTPCNALFQCYFEMFYPYPMFRCAFVLKNSLHNLSCYPLAVTLMTVVEGVHQSSFCAVLPAAESVGFIIITVLNRHAELLLMDSVSGSCIAGYDNADTALHLVSYIYTPYQISALKVVLGITGLDCMDPGLIVYHHKYVMKHDVIPYRQCALAASDARSDKTRRCEFICYINMCSRMTVFEVHIQVQKLAWVQNSDVKICDISL